MKSANISIITGPIASEMNVLKCRILTIKSISLVGQTLIIRVKESGETHAKVMSHGKMLPVPTRFVIVGM